MARPRTVYRGQGKYGWIVTLIVTLLVLALLAGLWLFYYLQRFIVYDKDTLRLVLPSERGEGETLSTDSNEPVATFTPVDVQIVVDQTYFSSVEAITVGDLHGVHARFLSGDALTQARLDGLSVGMGDYDALVLEMKPTSGLLRYHSSMPIAISYNVNGELNISEPLEKLRSKNAYLIARVSALADTSMATRYAPIALKNSNGSGVFVQDGTAWLDPYSETVRDYLSGLMQEMKELGFDEVLFNGFYLPDSPLLQYSATMTGTPDPLSAVSSLAVYLRAEADRIGIRMSVELEADPLLHSESRKVGQDLALFFKLFDRVAFDVSAEEQNAALSVLRAVAGEEDYRLLPFTSAAVPGLSNWVIR